MDAVSLKSLVVEYEVPFTLIIEAINGHRIHPKIIAGSTISFENIYFDHAEVAEVFKFYEWKHKTTEEKSELLRRLQKYDAITTGVLSAVIASGVTALGSDALNSISKESVKASVIPGSPDRRWEFHLPLEPPFKRFNLTMGGTGMYISMRPEVGLKFQLLAAEDGVVVAARRPIVNGIAVDHGAEWHTLYQVSKGLGGGLAPMGTVVRRGQPLIAIDGSGIGLAEATHGIWSISEGGEIKNATYDVVIHSEGNEAD